MNKICKNNDLEISYNIEGEGKTVVLIHGFLETLNIWGDFANELSKNYKVISIDLPGHGGSSLHSKTYTMCKYAEAVKAVIDAETIEKAFVVGHSMGGYVAMAFAQNYKEKLSGLCLFHSTPFADSDEKKKDRNLLVEKFRKQGKSEICLNHAKNIFSPLNIDKYSAEIEKISKNAEKIETISIIASIITIRDRFDRSDILQNLEVPFLHIHGEKDNFISDEVVNEINYPLNYEFVTLEKSGHIGFVEEKELSISIISSFIDNNINV